MAICPGLIYMYDNLLGVNAGPSVVFALYINDIQDNISSRIHLFADDSIEKFILIWIIPSSTPTRPLSSCRVVKQLVDGFHQCEEVCHQILTAHEKNGGKLLSPR